MSVKVIVREGESLASALLRLRIHVRRAYRRQWSKTRPGAYEQASYRRRKKEGLRQRNARVTQHHKKYSRELRCTVYIGLATLFSRDEVYQRERRPFRSTRRWHDEE